MKFNQDVVMFDFSGIAMVGSKHTRYVIGLNEAGAGICKRLMEDDVPEDDIASVDAALFEHLKKGGFFERGGEEPEPDNRVLSAYLHVTQRCNLTCAGCYSDDWQRNTIEDSPLEDMLHAVDELAAAGVMRLAISGGEPFLRRDLPEIVKHAKVVCGIQNVTVLSNGTCITKEALERLAPHVDCVSVSFDGCSASSPAYIRKEQRFDSLVVAIQAIKEAGIPAHMIPTVHAKNLDDLAEYLRLSKELGATLNFSLLSCEPDDEALGDLLPGEEELRKLGRSLLTLNDGRPIPAMDAPVGLNLTVKQNCGAGYKTLSVAADGTIYPCHMLQRPALAMGNAFTGTISDALESDISHKLRALDAAHYEDCSTCRHLYLCGGGCRARSMFESGNLESKDSYCAMTLEFYDCLGKAMKERIEQSQTK